METQDIKNMGLAYLQVLEAQKLSAKQQALDAVDDEKINAKDFAKLRKMKEEDESCETGETKAHEKAEKKKEMKLTKEEAELVSELSKATMGSYIKKASADNANKTSEKDSIDQMYPKHSFADRLKYKKELMKKTKNRTAGIAKAVDKITKEEVDLEESITKMSNARLKFHAVKDFPHGSYSNAEIKDEHKRRMKVEPNYHTVKPSLSEEIQIDELSKKTLGSYIKKAKTNVAGQAYQLGAKDPLKPKASWSKALGREKHIDKAVDRLTKEEVDQLDELSKKTLGSYAPKALNRGDIAARMSKSDDSEMGKIAKKRLDGAKLAVKKLGAKVGDKATATRTSTNIDKAKAAGRNYSNRTGNDDEGKSYYAAGKGINKLRDKSVKEETAQKWVILNRIQEKSGDRVDHVKGATAPEALNSKDSQKAKEFAAMSGVPATAAVDANVIAQQTADAIKASADKIGGSSNRPNDQKTGDKNIVK